MDTINNILSTVQELITDISFMNDEEQWVHYSEIEHFLDTIYDYFEKNDEHLDYFVEKVYFMASDYSNINIRYYFMTFLLHLSKKSDICHRLLEDIINNNISKNEKFFMWSQLHCIKFIHPDYFDNKCNMLLELLYSQVYEEFLKSVNVPLVHIPREERREDLVVVVTDQFLSMTHGPTKTVLDRSEILYKEMNKKVIIINTAESLSSLGKIMCYKVKIGGYNEGLNEINNINYHDVNFPYIQCESNSMPNERDINGLIREIIELKPQFILNIGGCSIFSDICSCVIPTISLGLAPSCNVVTRGQFQIVGHTITEEDKEWMKKMGFSQDHMVQTLFTSSFKEQTHIYNRVELGLPDDEFIVFLVGGRLNEEIDNDLEALIEKLMNKGIYFAFVGKYDKFREITKKRTIFEKYGIYLGFVEDILAVCECCDLYMNPKRIGGGTSVAEALYKGKPVVSFNYGDGGLGAGEDFWCKNYEEMYNLVLKYVHDKEYYDAQSNKALSRAEKLTNTSKEFVPAINKILESNSFF